MFALTGEGRFRLLLHRVRQSCLAFVNDLVLPALVQRDDPVPQTDLAHVVRRERLHAVRWLRDAIFTDDSILDAFQAMPDGLASPAGSESEFAVEIDVERLRRVASIPTSRPVLLDFTDARRPEPGHAKPVRPLLFLILQCPLDDSSKLPVLFCRAHAYPLGASCSTALSS